MPEKTLAELPRNQRELYDKGNAALQKKNFDYAIAIYNQVLVNEPGFYPGREALRACQLEKNKSAGGFFRKILGTASVSPQLAKAQYQVRANPLEALATCEQILNTEPNNVPAHKLLAEAAATLDFPKTAVLSLEIAFKNSPRDEDVGRRLAEALTITGQIDRAQEIYEDLQKQNPGNTAISQALKNLAANRTMRDQGYAGLESGTGSYRDILKDKGESASLEQEQREVKSEDVAANLIRDYEARLVEEPNNRRLLRSIAELYARKKDFDRALEYYAKITALEDATDPSLEREISETRLRKMEHEIARLDASAPDYPERRAALEKDRRDFEIAEARRRVEKHPNDLSYRHELAVLYYETGMIAEAIEEFQKSRNNPHKKISALYYLGLCFASRNMFDMAVRSLQNAIAEKPVFDEEKKELIYALGSVLEKSGKKGEAIEQFKQIYEVDIGYKDVGAKVDAFYANPG
jgi:tetratricopeptide (TPR) repeat protein